MKINNILNIMQFHKCYGKQMKHLDPSHLPIYLPSKHWELFRFIDDDGKTLTILESSCFCFPKKCNAEL